MGNKINFSASSIDLCDQCQYVRKTVGYGRAFKTCAIGDVRVSFPVESCSSFQKRGSVELWQLQEIAIHIEKKKDAPGFTFTRHVNGSVVEFK